MVLNTGNSVCPRTAMDYLVLGDFLFNRTDQPPWQETGDWRTEFELD